MVTQAEQDEHDEQKRNRASTRIMWEEEAISSNDAVVTWIKHVRPDRAGEEDEVN